MTAAIDYAHAMLRNWGAWSRDHTGHESLVSSVWSFWFPHKAGHRDAGWGDPGAPEALPPPVDERAAWAVELVMRKLASCHRRVLTRHYVLGRTQPELELQAGLRAFLDAREPQEVAWNT